MLSSIKVIKYLLPLLVCTNFKSHTSLWINPVKLWDPISIQRSCMQVARSHPSSNLSSFDGLRPSLRFAPLRTHARESLLASSLTHHKMDNSIYTTSSHYNFSIWDISFPLQFFNSMSLLWAIIFHSSINHFGHINIRN